MLEFLQTALPGYTPPTRQTTSKNLNNVYKEYRARLKTFFEKIDNVSITTDLWKNRNGSHFISLTSHFVDSKFESVNLLISFRRFYKRHLSINLKDFIIKELLKLNLLEKTVSVTCDSGADIKSATTNISSGLSRLSCAAHNLNLTVKNALNLWKAPCENDDEEIENCDDEVLEDDETLEDDDSFDEGETLSDDESDLEDQEEFSDFDINYSSSAGEIFLGIPKLLKKIRNIVKLCKNTTNIRRYFYNSVKQSSQEAIRKTKKKGLILDFKIRWNYTYLMLDRLIFFKSIVNQVIEEADTIEGGLVYLIKNI